MDEHKLLSLFHVAIVSVYFIYIGIYRDTSGKIILKSLFYLGIILFIYHSYKVYLKLINSKQIWVNLIHIFLVVPLLIYIGYYEENTERKYFELLLMLGFSSLGYHIYYLLPDKT